MQAHQQSITAARNLSVFPPPQLSPASTDESPVETTHDATPETSWALSVFTATYWRLRVYWTRATATMPPSSA